jgi:signal transduction histidine kinase
MTPWRQRNSGWVLQAAFIILPVAILAGVALHFSREDKAAIFQDAQVRAAALGRELTPPLDDAMEKAVSEALQRPGQHGVLTGRMIDGRPVSETSAPVPADWPSRLTARQSQLWKTAQDATSRRKDPPAAATALRALSGSDVESAARGTARLYLLTLEEQRGNTKGLAEQAIALAREFQDQVTDSGVRVRDLALLLALRHTAVGRLVPEFNVELQRSVEQDPSFLTPEVLASAKRVATDENSAALVRGLETEWQVQEQSAEKAALLLRSISLQSPLRTGTGSDWVDTSGEHWFGSGSRIPGGVVVRFLPREVLSNALQKVFADQSAKLPNYAGYCVTVGRENALCAASQGVTGQFLAATGGRRLQLHLFLANPDTLYAPYHRRLVMVEWLIFFSAAAAMLGLARLWHSYRAQQRLSEMKSNLVSSVSHELRAPIAAVRLMAESLESGRVEGEAKSKDYYRLIVRECRRLSSLVENVLDFARIDQGRKQYTFEPVDAAALLRHTMALMEPCAAERQVRLTLADLPAEFEHLQPKWDGEAVEQSLVNLVDNAVKHSPAGAEVRVEIAVEPGKVCFRVVDQGPGIPQEDHERIFDLFYRRGSELRRETEGVGIGLSIVKHVAEAHGGRVVVQSDAGKGSRFGLELPA